jgi:DNA-binding NarL/FixJ family response regulator
MEIKVLVCDDQALVRAGIRTVLAAESEITVVAELAGPREQAPAARTDPDIMIIGGRDAAGRVGGVGLLAARSPDAPAVVVGPCAAQWAVAEVRDLLQAGARGLVSADDAPTDLVRAVRVLAAGGAVLPPVPARLVIEWAIGRIADPMPMPPAASQLSPRELTVLELVAGGTSGCEVARRLHVSEATVRSHMHHILTKLGLRDRSQAVAFAYRHQLVRLDGRWPPDPVPRIARPVRHLHKSGARKSILD